MELLRTMLCAICFTQSITSNYHSKPMTLLCIFATTFGYIFKEIKLCIAYNQTQGYIWISMFFCLKIKTMPLGTNQYLEIHHSDTNAQYSEVAGIGIDYER